MGNYKNGVENTQDYLKGKKVDALMNLARMPHEAELPTHLRMAYGHVNWNSLIFELDDDIIDLIRKNEDCICEGKDVLVKMKKGKHVAIVGNFAMEPVTFKDMITGNARIELYDLDGAIDQAAHWFVDDLLDSVFSFSLFTPYFILAFRLALMEDEMTDEVRFAEERLEEVWCRIYSTVMYFAGKKLQHQAIDMGKSLHYASFNLSDYKIEDYLDKLKDEEYSRN